MIIVWWIQVSELLVVIWNSVSMRKNGGKFGFALKLWTSAENRINVSMRKLISRYWKQCYNFTPCWAPIKTYFPITTYNFAYLHSSNYDQMSMQSFRHQNLHKCTLKNSPKRQYFFNLVLFWMLWILCRQLITVWWMYVCEIISNYWKIHLR